MFFVQYGILRIVHYRIGSLENSGILSLNYESVHYRIGSLENKISIIDHGFGVHYRIGSLEIL